MVVIFCFLFKIKAPQTVSDSMPINVKLFQGNQVFNHQRQRVQMGVQLTIKLQSSILSEFENLNNKHIRQN
jgi:hypothetical protein